MKLERSLTISKNPAIQLSNEVLYSIYYIHLRNMAIQMGLPKEKTKQDNIDNISHAISTGKAHFKAIVTITIPADPKSLTPPKTLLIKTFRSNKKELVENTN
jgi:hypothetical protein